MQVGQDSGGSIQWWAPCIVCAQAMVCGFHYQYHSSHHCAGNGIMTSCISLVIKALWNTLAKLDGIIVWPYSILERLLWEQASDSEYTDPRNRRDECHNHLLSFFSPGAMDGSALLLPSVCMEKIHSDCQMHRHYSVSPWHFHIGAMTSVAQVWTLIVSIPWS